MMAGMRLLALLLAVGDALAVTPIEKVIVLLKDLQNKVEKQGAKEAVQYDKYACFCKNNAEFKKKAIEKSQEQIKVQEADIEDLEGKIQELGDDIQQLGKDIKTLEGKIEEETGIREKTHEDYLAEAKDLDEAIASCTEAIEALKASKAAMTGNAKLNLAQLKAAALKAKVNQSPEAISEALALVRTAAASATDAKKPGEAAASAYQSNEIISTIQDLEAEFKAKKQEVWEEEHHNKDASDKKVLGWTNEQTFKTKEKKEKSVLMEAKTSEKTETEQAKDDEDANEKSDTAFLKSLEESCKQKAKDWDQRSTARSEEMAALAEATATLENGASKQYSVNKKLTGLVQGPVSKVEASPVEAAPKKETKDTKEVDAGKKAPSFLQMRSVESTQAAVVKRMLTGLDAAASRLRSPVLAAVALKVQFKEDHFTNVRALIKDLIAKLKADAKSEATTKTFCDLHMKEAVDDRDKAALDIETQNGIIAKENAKASEAADEIQKLSEEVAQLHKDIKEADELRADEKASNEAAVAEAKAGAEAVKAALSTLKGFYGAAFLQANYKPPKSDRFGQTVDDAAPEAFSGEYKGVGESAKGIVGILEVIQSDFERTVTTTEKEEKDAVTDYDKQDAEMKKDIKEKESDKADAITAKENAEGAALQGKNDLHDAETDRENAEAELQKLAPMCVEGEETYAERVQKRQDEIAALKEAMQLLDDWQN